MLIEDVYIAIGFVLPFLLDYMPGIKQRFDKLNHREKQILVIIMVVVITSMFNSLTCLGYIDGYECQGWQMLGNAILTWIITQATHYGIIRNERVTQ